MSKNANNSRLPRAKGIDMATVYTPKECARKARKIVLPQANRQIVEEFIAILGMKEKFEEHDVPIPNKVVMYGPPGTGKTLTAFYIAQRLELPLIIARLDAIIHSHLGETGSNVRKIFEFAKSSPCVLFLDEFDAVARTRDNNDEVKEMARVVNTLLQCLDEFQGDSIFMAATNLENELDHAVWRRFDTKMTFGMPDAELRSEYIRLLIGDFARAEGVMQPACELLNGCSFADIEQIVLKAKRKAIIESRSLTFGHIRDAFGEYKPKIAIPV
ncbi:AAA family ATPase [Cohnella sp. CFH 77786]|uniref:AAA family ATPase n=1 Tax=Cohnella sp. CFH 77786 TaxID=2662265 RepID=UPI001C60A4AD|nr:ATP-binding protein [Cohnella sp. CFH 77786]MBW5446376.1 AAA family ATPase [Cohnella sp. CFH 77786]